MIQSKINHFLLPFVQQCYCPFSFYLSLQETIRATYLYQYRQFIYLSTHLSIVYLSFISLSLIYLSFYVLSINLHIYLSIMSRYIHIINYGCLVSHSPPTPPPKKKNLQSTKIILVHPNCQFYLSVIKLSICIAPFMLYFCYQFFPLFLGCYPTMAIAHSCSKKLQQ